MAVFFLLDIVLTGASLWAADWLRHRIPLGKAITLNDVYLDKSVYLAMVLIWGIIFLFHLVYVTKRTPRLLDELASVGAATLLACMAFATWLFFFDYDDFSRLLLFYFGMLDLCVLLNVHLFSRTLLRFIRAQGYNLKKVLIIGAGDVGTRVARALTDRAWTGFDIVGFLDDATEKQGEIWTNVAPVLGNLDQAQQVVEAHDIDEIIIALPTKAHTRLVRVVQRLQDYPVHIRVVPDLFSVATIRPQIEDLWGIPLIGIRQPVFSPLDAALKRALDLVGSIIGLVVFAPLMLIAALLIKLDSKGPVLFTQERVGENGRPFRMYKFRTMVINAEALLDQLIEIDKLVEPVFKLKNDPRTTRVGRILRRTSIDELPQLANVLKGEMSLVGPRPEEVRMVKRYSSWHRKRLAVKPGMTGPMQISGRGDLSLEDRVRLELDYIRNYSLWKDFEILIKTVPALIRGDDSC
jgi:exopolysaccharide biosynthesis polyprenyl glycosylphosphotransferase